MEGVAVRAVTFRPTVASANSNKIHDNDSSVFVKAASGEMTDENQGTELSPDLVVGKNKNDCACETNHQLIKPVVKTPSIKTAITREEPHLVGDEREKAYHVNSIQPSTHYLVKAINTCVTAKRGKTNRWTVECVSILISCCCRLLRAAFCNRMNPVFEPFLFK